MWRCVFVVHIDLLFSDGVGTVGHHQPVCGARLDDLQCEVVRPLPILIKDLLLLAVLIKVEVAVDGSLDTRNGAWEVGQQVYQFALESADSEASVPCWVVTIRYTCHGMADTDMWVC
jgi:hypothetical protein